jgi:hypothetical protein
MTEGVAFPSQWVRMGSGVSFDVAAPMDQPTDATAICRLGPTGV